MRVYYGFFFFQAEDGIRDLVRSRGLGDVYKRQREDDADGGDHQDVGAEGLGGFPGVRADRQCAGRELSLIHV